MESTNLITLLVGSIVTNLVTLVAAIIGWVRSVKMMPKDMTKADLENKELEVGIAEHMESVARNAALQVLDYQKQVGGLQSEIDSLSSQLKDLKDIKRQFTLLQVEVKKYQAENKLLWEWNKVLVAQVSKFEAPAPMPLLKTKGDDNVQ